MARQSSHGAIERPSLEEADDLRALRATLAAIRWLTAPEVAIYLGVSVRTVRAWTAAGTVPHTRLPGRLVLFDRLELDRWLAGRAASPVRGARR